MAILTAARSKEIRTKEIEDLDLDNNNWTIPEHKSKTRVEFTRLLVGKALEIIKWQIDTFGHLTSFVFPS